MVSTWILGERKRDTFFFFLCDCANSTQCLSFLQSSELKWSASVEKWMQLCAKKKDSLWCIFLVGTETGRSLGELCWLCWPAPPVLHLVRSSRAAPLPPSRPSSFCSCRYAPLPGNTCTRWGKDTTPFAFSSIATRRQPVISETLTFFGHADLKALLQPTVLAAVAGNFVDLTVLVSVACIHHVLLNAAPEKTLKQTQENVLDMDATR